MHDVVLLGQRIVGRCDGFQEGDPRAGTVRGFAGVDGDELFFGRRREAVGTQHLHVDTSLICVALIYLGTFAHAYVGGHEKLPVGGHESAH